MSELVIEDFEAPSSTLFFDIDDYVKVEKREGRLKWVDEIGWSSSVAVTANNEGKSEVALNTISIMMRSSYERNCHDLLQFLFDALANAVRDEGRWRILFGRCNVVDECLNAFRLASVTDPHKPEVWLRSALRLLTNCCGDPEEDGSADENKARVVAKLPISLVASMIKTYNERTEAVSLIYNIGVYDEKFRSMVVSAGLISALWRILEDLSQLEMQDLRLIGPVCEMLTWAPKAGHALSPDAFKILLGVSRHNLSCEAVESLIDVAFSLLDEQGLPHEEAAFLDLLEFVLFTSFLQKVVNGSNTSSIESLEVRFLGEDEEALVKPRETLIIKLSDLSGHPHLALHWLITSPPFEMMLNWIQASHFQIRICALTMLGNFAYQSDVLCTSLIKEGLLCNRLATLLTSETNGLVLKTALGAVQRFARKIEHRPVFGQSGILEIIAASWRQGTNRPLQEAALSTTRHLLSGSLENIDRFMSEPLEPQESLLQLLLETFERSEISETRLDIAWTSERMWRSIYSDPNVRQVYEDKMENSMVNETASALLQETIPRVHRIYPRILEPFLAILTSGNKAQIVAATYTLTIMLNEEWDYTAVYNTLCDGEGRDILLASIQKTRIPKALVNTQALVQKLRSHYANEVARTTNLTGLLQESEQAASCDVPNET